MNLDFAINLARTLMTYNGVGYLDFGFHDYEDLGIVGHTHFITGDNIVSTPYKITVSDRWVPFLSEKEFSELILHEIAHVKAGFNPPGGNHGPRWKSACVRLGIEPKRKFTTKITPHFMLDNAGANA